MTINEAYTEWEQEDQLFFYGLSLLYLVKFLLELQVQLIFGDYKSRLYDHSYAQMNVKARQLRTELRNTRKCYCSISEFLLRITTPVGPLLSIGESIFPQEQLDVMLKDNHMSKNLL